MRDHVTPPRPFGYFVHHQGRGHAERCADLVNALPPDRPVTVFCARSDIFPPLRPGVRIEPIPSLFEHPGDVPGGLDAVPTPDTLHCAPLGWPTIRAAMARITGWFAAADPVLMICDVSAEIAQLSRICSVPHVKVLQHGDRTDAGHRAAYDGAAGLLAPFDRALAQPGWDDAMLGRTHFAPGLGIDCALPDRATARRRLGVPPGCKLALAITGGGGNGLAEAPLGVAARSFPDWTWRAIGPVQGDWHATLPHNLERLGWIDDAATHIAAADLVVSSAGNTTCHRVLAAGVPWIVVPEWRYFDEQTEKAQALQRAGAAHVLTQMPASAHRWREAVDRALADHDPGRQRRLVARDAAPAAACWLETLAGRLWTEPGCAATGAPERGTASPSSPITQGSTPCAPSLPSP